MDLPRKPDKPIPCITYQGKTYYWLQSYWYQRLPKERIIKSGKLFDKLNQLRNHDESQG